MKNQYKDYSKKLEYQRIYARKKYQELKKDPDYKEYNRLKSQKWFLNNKERQNKNCMKDYYLNKVRWSSRLNTRRLIKKGKILIEKKCKNGCKSDKFQIHHEIYPTKMAEIKKAIEEGKIYYLCLICHNRSNLKVVYKKQTE